MTRGSVGGHDAHLSDPDDGGHSVDYDGGLRAVAEEHRIAVFQSGAQPIVRTDADIDSPFLNLVGNAIKYTAAGGRVHITLTVDDALGTATIAIRDTGRGIPAADLPHVFDKFYRVKSHAADGTPGTGLGLAIVKSIVDLHHGRVRVESAEGAGSTFFVDLPLGDRSHR